MKRMFRGSLEVINILMHAKEAREETNKSLDNCSTQELVTIEEKIRRAINNGEYYTCGGGTLSLKVQRKLKQLGYEVKTGTQYNEEYYNISWK